MFWNAPYRGLALVCFQVMLASGAYAASIVDNSQAAVNHRLTPPGVGVSHVGPALKEISGPLTPDVIYDNHCVVCHAAGVAGAPKLKDKAAWAPRIQQGLDLLMDHVIHGYKMMPPRGTCSECSDADLKATLDWMLKQSE